MMYAPHPLPRNSSPLPAMKGMSFKPGRPSGGSGGDPSSSSFLKGYGGGNIVSGLLSPALSASGGSTTVTPITPMTPLTTPRTPLQILLGRHNGGGGAGGPYRRAPSAPHSRQGSIVSDDENDDCEDDRQCREKQLLALQLLANFLNTAETALNDIAERENSGHRVVGPGIVRACNDLADEIEGLANELHAERAAREVSYDLALIEDDGAEEKMSSEDPIADATSEAALALSALASESREELITTVSTTHTLLLDTAAALRAVTHGEAQELGEVALEVARMIVWSLGTVHANMMQMTVSSDGNQQLPPASPPADGSVEDGQAGGGAAERRSSRPQHRVTWFNEKGAGGRGLGPVVEVLGEEKDDQQQAAPASGAAERQPRHYAPRLPPIPSSPSRTSPPPSPINVGGGGARSSPSGSPDRVRVLWPPLLPALTEAGRRCAGFAGENPLPAIAIGVTCGPAAVLTTAVAGPPLLVADWAVQSSYDALSEHTPVIENLEKGAASALRVAKLAVLCSKLLVKQGVRVGERQIERRGGVGRICSDAAAGAVDCAMHPVETAGRAWEGMFWAAGAVGGAVGFVRNAVSGGELRVDMH